MTTAREHLVCVLEIIEDSPATGAMQAIQKHVVAALDAHDEVPSGVPVQVQRAVTVTRKLGDLTEEEREAMQKIVEHSKRHTPILIPAEDDIPIWPTLVQSLITGIHARARSKGFYDDEDECSETRFLLSLLALLGSEVGEAVEEVRTMGTWLRRYREDGKTEGLLAELSDVIILTLGIVGWLCSRGRITPKDFLDVFEEVMAFNAARPHKHGKKA